MGRDAAEIKLPLVCPGFERLPQRFAQRRGPSISNELHRNKGKLYEQDGQGRWLFTKDAIANLFSKEVQESE